MTPAGKTASRAAGGVRDSTLADRVARAGMLARAGFYLVLTYLTVRVAVLPRSTGRQTNAQGALTVVSSSTLGKIAVGVAAVGFAAFGVVRLAAAYRDTKVERSRRLTTAGQGLLYLAMSYVPATFLAGNRQTGSEQQQHETTAGLLRLPAGRGLVVVLGLAFLAVCSWQLRTALTRDYEDGLDLRRCSGATCRIVRVTGAVGIFARGVVFLPIGLFLVVAGLRADARHVKGLDALLMSAAGPWWGRLALGVVALCFAVFAAYSVFEARYRDVQAGV